MNIAIGISLIVLFAIFMFFSAISTQHATTFRYLGPRTVYLTIIFVAVSSILIMLIIATYIALLLN
jgi:hypothetical protein